jgi:putative hydrolase of the HAD superfamily
MPGHLFFCLEREERQDAARNSAQGRVMPNQVQGRAVVLLDFGGTLDAEGIAWKDRFFRLWREEAGEIAPERFDPAFYAADDAVVGAVPPTLPFRETVERIVQGLARALNVSDPALVERIAKRFWDDAMERLHANRPLLSRLSARYRLGIVSNFYGNLDAVCAEVGIGRFFTVMVDSACVGCVKPDPRIFREALAAVKAEPAQAVFVGDSLRRDMAGARAIGMPHIWLKSKTSQEEGPCCPGDPVIHCLDELRVVL